MALDAGLADRHLNENRGRSSGAPFFQHELSFWSGKNMARTRSDSDTSELHPLSPLLLQILVTLAGGERHGYAILREIRNRGNPALDPGAGSLYGAIQRLLNEGAIEECRERPDPHLDDKRRRYYRITDFGRRLAADEIERLREFVRFAHGKLASKSVMS